MVFAAKRSEVTGGIEIRGRSEFLQQTRDALALLRRAADWNLIPVNIAVIQEGRRSGMKAWTKKPTFIVGRPTWQHSPLWYAGAIAHDAYHAKLYRDAKHSIGGEEPAADTWTGSEAEKQCLAFQRRVLREIGADAKTLGYIEECEKNPTYQGRNKGWRSWLDYLKRWW